MRIKYNYTERPISLKCLILASCPINKPPKNMMEEGKKIQFI